MRPRCSRAGRARRRAERPRLASSAPKQDFSPGGWGKPGRGQGDDRSRSYRSVGAAATCCSNWRRRALSQAGDAGCRRAGADAVARRASIWRRRSTDHGWRRMAVALRLTARQVDRKRVERRIRAMGSKRWAQSRRPAAPRRSTGPSPTCCVALRSAEPRMDCRHHLHPDGPRLPPSARPGIRSAATR